jgi:photosystem II stability/assembly factor-like uncharacterized protein
MRIAALCSGILLWASSPFAHWYFANPTPFNFSNYMSEKYFDISAIDSTSAMVRVYASSMMAYKTVDGGATWTEVSLPGGIQMEEVTFLNRMEGWATTREAPRVYHTSDGGRSWESHPFPCPDGGGKLWFTSSKIGYVASAPDKYRSELDLYRTTDGGRSWDKCQGRIPFGSYRTVAFFDSLTGYMQCGGDIKRTVDGGKFWHYLLDLPPVRGFYFIDASHGWALTWKNFRRIETIYRTIDGGDTWTYAEMSGPLTNYSGGGTIHFADRQSGWVDSRIWSHPGPLVSNDSGATWSKNESTTMWRMSQFKFSDARHGWAICRSPEASEYGIHRTTDGGITWKSRQQSLTDRNLRGVTIASSGVGWVVGDSGTVLRTGDSGITWKVSTVPTRADLLDVCAVGERVYAVGRNGTVMRSGDDGSTWIAVEQAAGCDLRACTFVDQNTGWVVGDNGTILHTEDGGAEWNRQRSGVVYSLRTVSFLDESKGIAAGKYGIILYTNDGGLTWHEVKDHADARNINCAHYGPNFAWIGGDDGCFYSSSDGGKTWISRYILPNDGTMRSLAFVNGNPESLGWVLFAGNITETRNECNRWTPLFKAPYPDYFSSMAVDPLSGTTIIVGNEGMLLHGSLACPGGQTRIGNEGPLTHNLRKRNDAPAVIFSAHRPGRVRLAAPVTLLDVSGRTLPLRYHDSRDGKRARKGVVADGYYIVRPEK